MRLLPALTLLLFVHPLFAQSAPPPAITSDPAVDKAHPASMETVQIPSHGALLNGLVYVASGAGPHPVVILLHGFPGNEKNLDVVYFDYRGSWGTPGAFSFTHAFEDTAAAVSWVREPATAARLRLDPKRIVLIGHSMGGMMAAYTAANDHQIVGLGLISAWNIGAEGKLPADASPEARQQFQAKLAENLAREGLAPLAGCTPASLAAEIIAHAAEWTLPGLAPQLATTPTLIVTADDGSLVSSHALAQAMQSAGNQAVNEVHFATDHPYSDKRIALTATVLGGLDYVNH
jgi:pimeloyl-ACP methyl ester carboxylesterase